MVAGLGRPGGNITGLALLNEDVPVKQREPLKAVVPRPSRVALLGSGDLPLIASARQGLEMAARAPDVELHHMEVARADEVEAAFAGLSRIRAGGVLVRADPLVLDADPRRIVGLADLPVEQASKFSLVVNLKTARALGPTLPPSLQARDRNHPVTGGAMALTIDPTRTAILPLDLQNDNIEGTAGIREKQILEKIAQLLEAGRRKKVRIIHITASVRADYLDIPRSNELWLALRRSRKLIMGTPGAEIHPLVAPKPDELVINKTCVDPFLSTNLGQVLINFDVNTLVVCGLWTNYVVEATTRHAADVGYHVIVVSDCCASNNEENHRFAMDRILPTLATVAPLD